jgi:hypothetical protein
MRNCRLGDLAITVNCEIPENLGKIVRIIGQGKTIKWSDRGKTFVWKVESARGERSLVYEIKGRIVRRAVGSVPDIFLRPIRGQDIDDALTVDIELPQLILTA